MIIEISKELQLDMNDINEEDDDYSELGKIIDFNFVRIQTGPLEIKFHN